MKKTVAIALLLALCLPLAVLADDASVDETEDVPVIYFTDVAELIRTESPNIKNNAMTLLNIVSNDRLGDAQAARVTQAKGLQAMGVDEPMLGMMATQLMQQAVSMNITPGQQALYRIQFELIDKQYEQAGESLYLNLIRVSEGLERARRARPLVEQALLLAQTAESVGMGTESDTLAAQLRLSDLDALVSTLALNELTLTFELNKLLGREFDAAFATAQLPDPDLDYYAAIDLEADLRTAVRSSFRLRYLNQERSNIGYSDYRATARERQMKDSEIQMETQALGARLTLLYHKIANNIVVLENQELRLKLAQAEALTAEIAFEAGQISELALKQAQEALQAQIDAVSDVRQTLFWDIRSYQWNLAGLSV